MASKLLILGGLFVVAVTARYRKNPSGWEYLCFFALAVLVVAVGPPSSPLFGAIPLMLSYVLDYIDERRQKRAALAEAAIGSDAGRAEPFAAPNVGPAASSDNSRAGKGPPSVS